MGFNSGFKGLRYSADGTEKITINHREYV